MSTLIDTILKENDIVQYLEQKGHEPARKTAGRLVYSCPVHGPEANPSFYVFFNKEVPYAHCFGCSFHGNVINLCSTLEKISLREAIGRLARGLNIPPEDAISQETEKMIQPSEQSSALELTYFILSSILKSYLRTQDNSMQELVFIEKLFEKIDAMLHDADVEGIHYLNEVIYNLLDKRASLLSKENELNY